MLEIDSIRIVNFKSIKDYTFDFKSINSYSSKVGIFVGLNESGKSAFLEAISFINNSFDFIDYKEYCNNEAQDDDLKLELIIKYNINSDEASKIILSSKDIDSPLSKNITIKSFSKTYSSNGKDAPSITDKLDFEIKYIDLNDYYMAIYKDLDSDGIPKNKSIIKRRQTSEVTYRRPTKLDIEDVLKHIIINRVIEKSPKIQLWKSRPEYLISDPIDLNKFKEDPNTSIPLKNIFSIYGKKSKDDIINLIEKILISETKKEEFQDKISETITRYINKIWVEHKIKIKISVNGSICNVFVEDKDKKYSYFSMAQRSDGFKQFISLILSLSTLNETAILNNNIILIDEPEVHLHPSGIAYMRDELLKIGKNNIVLVSTHSPYLIDVNIPQRHYIVTKRHGETKIEQVDENTNFKEDSVLKNAFGLNLYKELLPEKIIIVEGGDDKFLFNHCFNQYDYKNFAIKSAGGASKVPGFASLLSNENLAPIIIFDADKEGKDNKKKILDNYKDSYNNDNVFTIKDLNPDLPDNSTIEDLYPLDFLKKIMEKELQVTLQFKADEAVLIQLKNQNDKVKNDKQKLESLKIKISKEFIEEYKTFENLQAIDRLNRLILELKKRTMNDTNQ